MTDTLAHYGVKNMHWGVRREGTRGSTPPSARAPKSQSLLPGKKKAKTAGHEEEASPKRPMTEAELRSAINRIKLEREYANLMAPPPREKSEMRKIAEAVVKDSVKAAGTKVLTGALTNAMTNVLPPGLRSAPKKSKTDEVAEKVLKGLKGDQKKGKDDDGGGKKSSGDGDAPKKPSGGGDKKPNENGFVKPSQPYTPRRSRSSSGGFKNPFSRGQKTSGSSQPPPVRVPDATVRPKPTTPESHALPSPGSASQGRPGHSGSGRSYDNDASNADRRGGSAEQGRPGSTGKRKKRRFGFGHEGLDGIVVDILGEID